jgi:hypothetical protein
MKVVKFRAVRKYVGERNNPEVVETVLSHTCLQG